MNNPGNSNFSFDSRSMPASRAHAAFGQIAKKDGAQGIDKPRVLRMSSTLRRMLNEVDAAQNSDADQIARA